MCPRSGKKAEIIDVFSPWSPVDQADVRMLRKTNLPDPLINMSDILVANFEWSEEMTLPYDVFDELRLDHGIDVTGLQMSMTHRGNVYRSSALLHGRV